MIYPKMHPILLTNTRHDVIDLVKHRMVENIKTLVSWQQNIALLKNKKIHNMCLEWPILRSYRFVMEVTFKKLKHIILGADYKKKK